MIGRMQFYKLMFVTFSFINKHFIIIIIIIIILIAFQVSIGNQFLGFDCADYYGEAFHRYPLQM